MIHNGTMSIPRPSERPSFGQRDSYREVLSEGYAQGRLNDAEFSRRTEEALAALSLRRLEELIDDLPRGALPVPVERGHGNAGAEAARGGRRGARTARRSLVAVMTAAALVGLTSGLVAGPLIDDRQTGDRASVDGDTTADDTQASSTTSAFAYDDVIRAFDLAADYEEVSRVLITGTSAQLHVPTASGTTYDVVTADQQGRVSTEPGGTYGEEDPGARIDPAAIDPQEIAAMAARASRVFAGTTGLDGNSSDRLDLGAPGAGTEYAGVEPGAPVVRVSLSLGDYGDGGGTVIWTPDGERVLEVRE